MWVWLMFLLAWFSYACVQGPHRSGAMSLEPNIKLHMVSSCPISGIRIKTFEKILTKVGCWIFKFCQFFFLPYKQPFHSHLRRLTLGSYSDLSWNICLERHSCFSSGPTPSSLFASGLINVLKSQNVPKEVHRTACLFLIDTDIKQGIHVAWILSVLGQIHGDRSSMNVF